MKKAIITGVTGQDGSYLSEILLDKGYIVYGMIRRSSTDTSTRISHLKTNPNFHLVEGDITDQGSLDRLIQDIKPDEFYNLAAQSFVKESWNQPELTMNVTGMGTLRCLEAIRKFKSDTKFYQASSSEMFGKITESPQNENTPFYPRSPYGVAKLAAHWTTINYRESYNIFACSGILMNHESSRRGIEFVTRKISDGVARIITKKSDKIVLGNLDAKRDWGHAKDYMEAAYLMMQAENPDTFVIATGETHSIRDFLIYAFSCVGIEKWESFIEQDPKFMRPAEVDVLCGDYSKAKQLLGWEPTISFKALVREMVFNDIGIHDPEMGKRFPDSKNYRTIKSIQELYGQKT